jgi:hypothetical protein
MAIQFRETRARFKERVRFLGLETSPVPIVIAAVLSVLLITLSYYSNRDMSIFLRTLLCGSPLLLTLGYIWLFKTGRRPNLDRDLFMWVMNGNTVSPWPPASQPIHPGYHTKRVGSGVRRSTFGDARDTGTDALKKRGA